MDFLHTLFYFLIAISILVSIHEFGHFWVARKVGVKVLRFSLGFGKVLYSYQKNANATEYVISAIPLGGYVKMLDEREGEVLDADLPFAFNRQALWARTSIVAAGPLFNLALAVALFWGVLVIGETGIKPMIGVVVQGTLAATAGFVEGDEIISVNDKVTPTWTEAMTVVVSAALEGEHNVRVVVKNNNDQQATRILALSDQDSENPDVLYQRLGLKPLSPSLQAIIGNVLPDSAALTAGLQQGDLIVSANTELIVDWMQWVGIVKSHGDVEIKLVIERDGVRLPLVITPKKVVVGQLTEGKVGASVYMPEALIKSMTVEYALSPLAAIPVAFETTYSYSVASLKMLTKMLIGKASVDNLSGPLSIAQYAGQSATMGFVPFIKFMALVSVSLGILNLLPIPVLDGGHLLFYAIEGIKGSPVSEKVQLFFQQIGITLLVSLMALAMFLDVERLFQ
jgi:regulator of sigma E protease